MNSLLSKLFLNQTGIRVIKPSTDMQKFMAITNRLYLQNWDITTNWTLKSDHISEVLQNNRLVQSGSFISQLWKNDD